MTFSVDPLELSHLASSLEWLRDDVTAIRTYVGKWTDFHSDGELLPMLADPHDNVVREIRRMLDRVHTLLDESATAMGTTLRSYRDTDHVQAARFDGGLPAAQRPDPAATGIYRPVRAAPPNPEICVGAPADVTGFLKTPDPPKASVSRGYVNLGGFASWVSPTSWIDGFLGAVGVQPVAEASKFFAGDWEGYACAAQAFEYVNKALNAVAVNLAWRNERVGHTWRGNAADAANAYFHTLADAIANQRWAFQDLRKEYDKAATAVWMAAKVVEDVIGEVSDKLIFAGLAGAAAFLLSGGTASVVSGGLAIERLLSARKTWEKAAGPMTKAATTMTALVATVNGLAGDINAFNHPLPDSAYRSPLA